MEETVERLTPKMSGRWFVRTQGSEHLFDLDLDLYERHQLDGLNPMRRDREPLPLPKERILRWPCVGRTFILLVPELVDKPLMTTVRRSSVVTAIVRAPDVPNQSPPATV